MSVKKDELYVGFPAGYLGSDPCRLRVLHQGDGFIVLEKPAGVLIEAHPWYRDVPSLVGAMRLQDGKPELLRLGVGEVLKSVYSLEPEVLGIAVLGATEGGIELLRNAYGSHAWGFKFEFLALDEGFGDELSCDLPLAAHWDEPHMVVSRKTGKSAHTDFKRIKRYGQYSLWEARLDYFRMHQVRVHAHELGLRIIGEGLYGGIGDIYLSSMKRGKFKKRSDEKPLNRGICLYLREVVAREWSSGVSMPVAMRVMLKQLEKWGES